MNTTFSQSLDNLILRGGTIPAGIYESHEEYLSRLAILNRKLQGVMHRVDTWQKISEEHLALFNKKVNEMNPINQPSSKGINTFRFSLRDIKVENEFEALLYSISNALSALTRVIACFFENATDFHSHSKLGSRLQKLAGFEKTGQLVDQAYKSWATELTNRRDTATHYIALTATSSFKATIGTTDHNTIKTHIGITKQPIRFSSLWQDELPTIGGSQRISFKYENGDEIHEIKDNSDNLIVRRTAKLQDDPELINGSEYIKETYEKFSQYVVHILESLKERIA